MACRAMADQDGVELLIWSQMVACNGGCGKANINLQSNDGNVRTRKQKPVTKIFQNKANCYGRWWWSGDVATPMSVKMNSPGYDAANYKAHHSP